VSVATLVAVLVFATLLLAGEHVLALVGGPEFTSAYSSLLWLTAAGCVDLCTVGFEPVLMAANRAGSAFFVRLAATGTMFAAAFLLSPSMGANGIAAGVLIASVVTAVLLAAMLASAIRRDRLRSEGMPA
jgi:O-antigen/teichoic acid export membrane protein